MDEAKAQAGLRGHFGAAVDDQAIMTECTSLSVALPAAAARVVRAACLNVSSPSIILDLQSPVVSEELIRTLPPRPLDPTALRSAGVGALLQVRGLSALASDAAIGIQAWPAGPAKADARDRSRAEEGVPTGCRGQECRWCAGTNRRRPSSDDAWRCFGWRRQEADERRRAGWPVRIISCLAVSTRTRANVPRSRFRLDFDPTTPAAKRVRPSLGGSSAGQTTPRAVAPAYDTPTRPGQATPTNGGTFSSPLFVPSAPEIRSSPHCTAN